MASSQPGMSEIPVCCVPVLSQFKSYVTSEGSCNNQGPIPDLEQSWQLLTKGMKSQIFLSTAGPLLSLQGRQLLIINRKFLWLSDR